MLNISARECREQLRAAIRTDSESQSKLETISQELSSLNNEREDTKRIVAKNRRKIDALRSALVLIRPIPVRLAQLRSNLLAKMEKVGSEAITIATYKKLLEEIEQLKKNLKNRCPHPFIFERQGYEGSASHDFKDARPGVRHCVVCKFEEQTYDIEPVDLVALSRRYIYKTLINTDTRVIEREPLDHDGNIWRPLGAVLHPFEVLVARDINE